MPTYERLKSSFAGLMCANDADRGNFGPWDYFILDGQKLFGS